MGSKRAQRRRECRKKVKFDDHDTAFKEGGKMRARHPGEVFDVYRCRVCGAYHIGHRPHGVSQAIKRRREAG